MAENKLEFIIKTDISGEDLDMDNMSITAAKSLVTILDSITKIIEATPGNEDVKITVAEGGSAHIVVEAPDDYIGTLEADFDSIEDHQCTSPVLVGNWRRIQSLLTGNGMIYEVHFYKDGQSTPLYERITTSRKYVTKGERNRAEINIDFISGKLYLSGGIRPNMHLQGDDEKYIVSCDEFQAKNIGALLYTKVFMSTWCKKGNKRKDLYCDVYTAEATMNELKEFVESNREKTIEAELLALHNKVKEYVDLHDNFSMLRKLLRLYNQESIEIAVLKTILVATKSFKNNDRIAPLRNDIKRILEKKLGQALI